MVGIDHAFSFPQSYMDRNGLKSWSEFLQDFEENWPTRESTVRELLPGNPRTGNPDEHRLTGQWTAFPKSVFHFDIQDSLAKATHAGLPWLDYLRRAGDRAHFWPFDGFAVPKGRSVIAEVRPARLRHRYRKEDLSSQEQDAYAVCAWLRERDQLGLAAPLLHAAPLGTRSRTGRASKGGSSESPERPGISSATKFVATSA